ncbi:nitroreductase family protein [Maribacter sp. MAR_2009_72]|uniref:nitroreductase family protein n=1 Tax=Maribacter sp. MAR_2009_72 TaxID=1250050 RepID=UPI00119AAA91|nr:nitroreductase family protein [Maribacter sp. MAR_2009_72]TVZ14358.1 nitroreductase [Maribacter sp. MAR_2009_72]
MVQQEHIEKEKVADTDHELLNLLKQRYSPRIFSDQELREEEMQTLFEAARWSASSNNWQPWRFIYAHKGSDTYDKIAECLGEFNQSWATNAPVLMLSAYKKTNPEGKENFHALHDLGMCLGTMAIQAEHMGIALHHMAGLDWKKAHNIFKVPEEYHITTGIAIGYYGGTLSDLPEKLQEAEVAKRKRKPQEEFAFKNEWRTI